MTVTKLRTHPNGTQIYLPIRAVDSSMMDTILTPLLPELERKYENDAKTAADWVWIANVIMAFGDYHDKLRQCGMDQSTYA